MSRHDVPRGGLPTHSSHGSRGGSDGYGRCPRNVPVVKPAGARSKGRRQYHGLVTLKAAVNKPAR